MRWQYEARAPGLLSWLCVHVCVTVCVRVRVTEHTPLSLFWAFLGVGGYARSQMGAGAENVRVCECVCVFVHCVRALIVANTHVWMRPHMHA